MASLTRDRLVLGPTSQSSFVRMGSDTLNSRCPGLTPSCSSHTDGNLEMLPGVLCHILKVQAQNLL